MPVVPCTPRGGVAAGALPGVAGDHLVVCSQIQPGKRVGRESGFQGAEDAVGSCTHLGARDIGRHRRKPWPLVFRCGIGRLATAVGFYGAFVLPDHAAGIVVYPMTASRGPTSGIPPSASGSRPGFRISAYALDSESIIS